ncbi:class I adenylate-forming enzyme family protein [Mycobacterium parmense]|uniref:AMP-binding protein n=1 Tax=Mycobacterium parmense TaxID=185642 RepID=A0A7I7YPH7_9MYCO|nr:class I adenylate-forming enzyme family protein [Mycobacterium parmense]MCV7349077.1 acyl--CoA ligase [Mycobacterium parmense]ORW58401.1 AMP-binding protein [Mycobacterium parmense]BBZ43044.1 AMP-binding protein [Mycobacterium parmense]
MPDTIDRLVTLQAARHHSKPMVIDPASRLSYRELDSTTRDLAARFVEAGVGKGTPVGLIMPNGVRWVQVAIALTRVGAVLVPLSTLLTARELTAQLRAAAVRYLVSVEEFRGHRYLDELGTVPQPGLPALREVWTVDRLDDMTGERARRVVGAMAETVTAADPLVIMFTSGSSGAPKGVLHSHGNALGAVRSGLAARCITAETRLYLPMPFFWVGGFGAGILSTLLSGATLVTEQIPRPETTLRLLETERVTLFRGWPDQAEALAKHADAAGADLTALRPGSLPALLPPEHRAQPGARATLFGMTEAFGPYCGYPADTDMPRAAWGSCGKPFPGIQIRIVDPDTGDPVAADTAGMIQIRGPHILRGICRRSREEVFTDDGFYPTGDLGLLSRDGFLFYHGRSDDMFKVSGATVYPSEVERALRTVDGVRNAFVTDVPGAAGTRVGAAVVAGEGLTEEQLRRRARTSLSAFKVPTVWLLLTTDDDVPRGGTGKVDTRRLREMLTDADRRASP